MYTGYADTGSYVFYFLLGFLFVFASNRAMMRSQGVNIYGEPIFKKFWVYATMVLVVYTIVAAFRAVGTNLGGQDAVGYVEWFQKSDKESVQDHLHGIMAEPLFHYLCRFFRSITSNYHIFFLFCYGLITYSYLIFMKRYAPVKVSCIPLLLMIFPYLKSFCTLRSSIAFSLILIGLVLYKRHKWAGIIIAFSSMFVHRMCLPFMLVIPFLMLMEKREKRMSKKFFLWTGVLSITIAIIFSSSFGETTLAGFIIGGVDESYVTLYKESSILDSWPRLFPYFTLFIAYYVMYNKIKWDKQSETIMNIFLFDLLLMPIAIILNIWRFNEVFYIVRMLSWGVIMFTLKDTYFKHSKSLVDITALFVFCIWLYIRIDHEWNDLKIMPYILDII